MKKKLCRITALLLAAVLSLGGCGQPGAGKKRTDSTQQTEETKVELQGDVEGNALVLKAVTEDEAGTMFFSLDNMKFNLLDDGKLCLIAEDDAEESDDGEEADDSETGEVDFSVKTYFEKIIVTE